MFKNTGFEIIFRVVDYDEKQRIHTTVEKFIPIITKYKAIVRTFSPSIVRRFPSSLEPSIVHNVFIWKNFL